MAERTSGWRKMFSVPAVYRLAQRAIGSPNVRRALVEEYLKPSAGDRMLDIGCGTGDLLDFLDDIEYFGYDLSTEYIEAAIRTFGHRATFLQGAVGEAAIPDGDFDIAVSKGVLHHLDDGEARELFQEASRVLRPGGRLVTIDPTYEDGQAKIARFLASRDRGMNVRTLGDYRALTVGLFSAVEGTTRHDLLRVPYSHAILVATR